MVDVEAEEVDGGMSVDFFFQVVLGESEVEVVVDVLDGVSDSVNVWDVDAVMDIDVDVIPGEAVIGGKLDTVDILAVVEVMSWVISEVGLIVFVVGGLMVANSKE